MEHTKKFYFVPPDLLAQLNEKSDNLKRISSNLEKNVVNTISKKNVKSAKRMPADKRAILYSQYLQKYLAHKNRLSSPISPIVKVSEIDKDKNKSKSAFSESDIEKMKNDIANIQSVFNQKYSELVQALPEYWKKGADVSGIDYHPSSSYHRMSTPLPRSSSLSAMFANEDDLARRFSTEREQLAREQLEIRKSGKQRGDFEEDSEEYEDAPSDTSGATALGNRSRSVLTSAMKTTKHRKGRTKSIQKLIADMPLAEAQQLEERLHERITRSKAPAPAAKQTGTGFSFNANKWKTYYQYKL